MTSWICLQITSLTLHLSNTRGWEIHINSLLPSRIILRLRCRDFGSRVRNPQCWIVGYLGIAVGEIYFSIAAGAFPITLPIYAYFIPNILGEVDNETAVLAGFVAKAPTRKFHLDKSKRIQTKPIAFHCAWWVPPQKKNSKKLVAKQPVLHHFWFRKHRSQNWMMGNFYSWSWNALFPQKKK